jgi:nicotinamidase-related amidase
LFTALSVSLMTVSVVAMVPPGIVVRSFVIPRIGVFILIMPQNLAIDARMQVESPPSGMQSAARGAINTVSDRHPDLLSVDRTAVFVVDVQENFRPHIHDVESMLGAIRLVVAGAARLGVPVGISEQYPQGLGATVSEIRDLVPDAPLFDKMEISSCEAPGWRELPSDVRDRECLVIVGIETHVCVSQTVHDLLHAGKRVHVVADAVGSRDPWQRDMALRRLERAGATITTAETVLFELLGCAGTPEFKDVQRLIKERDAARRESLAGASA